jgi:hypothetical protein
LNTRTHRRRILKVAAGGLVASAAAIACRTAQAKNEAESLPHIPAGRIHVLESTKGTVSMGVLDPARAPAVTIDSGDIVHYPNTWTVWGNEAKYGLSFDEREPIRKRYPSGPYSNVGPVAVGGAEPGDVLETRWLKLRPIDWGWNSFPLGVGALPSDFGKPYVHYFRFDKERALRAVRQWCHHSVGAVPRHRGAPAKRRQAGERHSCRPLRRQSRPA